MGCRGRIYVQLSWAVSNWAVECEQWRNLLMCMGSLVTEATLHYSKWEVRQVQSWSLPQTETETGKGNSIFIVLPRFREKKFHNSLLSLAPLGCIEKTTQIWGNGSVGQVLASKCKDPSCTQGPIKISHDLWLWARSTQVLYGRVVFHLIFFLHPNSCLGNTVFLFVCLFVLFCFFVFSWSAILAFSAIWSL